MKKITTLLSILFLGASLMSFQGIPECETGCEIIEIEDITFIVIEEEIELGFDTAKYLPQGFDPYQGMEPNFEKIAFIETEEEIALDFDTAQYLPEGFNAYKGMVFNINEIEFIETEEEIVLDIDIQTYLPEGFTTLSK